MAYHVDDFELGTLVAGADLTADQYKIVKVDAAGKLVLTGAADEHAGILDCPGDTDESVRIRVSGVAKVVAGAAITTGDGVESDAAGKLRTLTTGPLVGIALEAAGADGDIISVLLK